MLHLNHFHCFYEQDSPFSDTCKEVTSRLHQAAELCGSSLRAGTASLKQSNTITLSDLPIIVQLHIFSYLDARSLCQLAVTSSRLSQSSCDSLLWSRLLARDSLSWSVLGHLSYPPVYTSAGSELSPKEIYEACYSRRECIPQRSFTHPLTTRLRGLVRRLQGHVPKLLVVGSGLETLPFIRTLLWEEQSPYKPIGMSPGKDGIGSGVCVQHRDRPLNLVTLYRAPKAERTSSTVNKLLTASREELTPGVQELCQQADGLVLVVDSTEAPCCDDASLLSGMIGYCPPGTPALILACSMKELEVSPPPLCWAESLQLTRLSVPWQVRRLNLEATSGLEQGMDWLLTARQ